MRRRRALQEGEVLVDAVPANIGIQQAYQRRLDALVRDMHVSVDYWVRQKYGAHPPLLATDASPAAELRKLMRKLSRRWQTRFDKMAETVAEEFAKDVQDRNSAAIKAAMRKAGWTIKPTISAAQRDVFQGVVGENVSLIKSIPQQYLGDVEGAVMRSVTRGGDLGTLTTELEQRYDITRRRAALIARDQNRKTNAAFTRVRQQEIGGEEAEAIFVHSHGGKQPRPTHVAMDGSRYKVSEGIYDADEGRNIWPGELINCGCTSRMVIRGFS